jgi:hypothetical protein
MYEAPQPRVRKASSGDPMFSPPGGVSPQQVSVAVGVKVGVGVSLAVGEGVFV